jgi:protein-S-isoprenylcysteine O-methyltransferase Ste14
MSKINKKSRILNLAWLPYILILFEMLYMATPFAAFFYSVYEIPLKFLNENTVTAWLIQTILPHFVETNSRIIHLLVGGGWLMMAIGAVVFLIGFIQIYYSKFTGKGAVTGGIYNMIRHPQYMAWILFGLGMSLVWSRLIVWIMFVTMIFIYYLLAKVEEKECMEKYPETYPQYFSKTGMFFPKLFAKKAFNMPFPKNRILYGTYKFIIYLLVVSITIISGLFLRNYTISNMSTAFGDNYMAVSISYISPQLTQKTVDIILKDSMVLKHMSEFFLDGEAKVFYVMPQTWIIPELGMTGAVNDQSDPHLNSAPHGNPKDTAPMKKRVLISMAKLIKDTEPSEIMYYLKQQVPKLYVDIDLETEEVTAISTPPHEGIYSDIPVPVY